MKYISLKYFILLFVSFYFISCNNSPKKPIINPKEVITFVQVLSFNDLDDQQKEDLKYGCFCHPDNWYNGIEFKKENAYFVKVKLKNKLLAELSESEAFPISYLLNSNAHTLYGKYHNRWKFIDSTGNKICETDKFDGHKIIELNRFGELDEVIIGPLITKPTKMEIEIADSKYYPNLTPEYKIE